MQEEQFTRTLQQENQRQLHMLQMYEEPVQMFHMDPMQANHMECLLNSAKPPHVRGYILRPVRRAEQILYKTALKPDQTLTFQEEEKFNLVKFFRDINSVKNKISQNQFHYFMTLQQLRRHPLSRYFMVIPDPLYLKLYDYKTQVGHPLDIRQIGNKVLQRKYKQRDDFETDMVTLFQNHKIYFINDMPMFDNCIKLQMLFWDIYTNEEKLNKEAMETYKYYKNMCKRARGPRKNAVYRYTDEQKRELMNQFNNFSPQIKKKIIFCLEVGPLKNQKIKIGQGLNLKHMKNNFFVSLEELLKNEEEKAQKKVDKQRKMKKQMKSPEQLRRMMREDVIDLDNDIYYSDEEEEDKVEQNNVQVSRAAVQQVLDRINMEQAIFGSDDDEQ